MRDCRSAETAPSSEDEADALPDVPDSLDLRRGANFSQACAALAGAAVGAVIGFGLTNNRPDLAALAGAVVGLILATFVSGLVLMCLPRKRISLDTARKKLQTMKRRANVIRRVSALVFLVGIGLVFALAKRDNPWAFLVCIAAICLIPGVCMYRRCFVIQVRELEEAIREAEARQAHRHVES